MATDFLINVDFEASHIEYIACLHIKIVTTLIALDAHSLISSCDEYEFDQFIVYCNKTWFCYNKCPINNGYI